MDLLVSDGGEVAIAAGTNGLCIVPTLGGVSPKIDVVPKGLPITEAIIRAGFTFSCRIQIVRQ